MSDISNSETAHSAPPPSPAPRPRRPWTILGRLSRAVREQNWFAVVLELAIVVLGVVIGFQVTTWGQDRADRVKEQAYLHQLVRDLAETERQVEDVGRTMAPLVRAPRRLAQAYFLPEPPPRDSVVAWALIAPVYYEVSPVLGTAEALVATGDIGLIRDDSLRTAITTYLEIARQNIRGGEVFRDQLVQSLPDFVERVPWPEIYAEVFGPAALDSLDRADNWRALVPPGVPPPVFDAGAFVRDVRTHHLMVQLVLAKINMAWSRNQFRRNAAALREQVEAELNQ